MWDYAESLDWLYGRQKLGIKLGLGKVHRLLAGIGDPQDAFHAVHVAGTNGKGSVVRMLAEILRLAGHHVGTTTSPHLVRFTERIDIDGEAVSEDEVRAGLLRIRPVVETLDAAAEPPTFFEVVTALAFHVFRERGVEWAVVETGLGGRLDATNVLRPRLTVITNVERDHQAFLGEHVAEIAYEKAGIMKSGVPCVTAARGDALVVLKAVSHEMEAPMSIIGEDYHAVPDVNGLRLVTPTGEARFDLALPGEHQIENAAVAVASADALRAQGVDVPAVAVRQALAHVRVPGRLESFHVRRRALDPDGAGPDRAVEVLLDGAHNEAAAAALRRHLVHRDWAGFHLVTGFNADKAWEASLDQWAPLAGHVWGVPLRNPRSLDPQCMADPVRGYGVPFDGRADVADALLAAVRAGAERILVAGSLYLVGEARAVLGGEGLEEIRGSQ